MGMGSPYYQLKEYDLTQYLPTFKGVVGALVLDSAKGEVGKLHFSTNEKEYIERHGIPNPRSFGTGIYSGINFLQSSDKLFTARVDKGQTYSSVLVRSIIDPTVTTDAYGYLLETPIVDPIVKPNDAMSKEDIESYVFTQYEADREEASFSTAIHLAEVPSVGDTKIYLDNVAPVTVGDTVSLKDTTGLDRAATILFDVHTVVTKAQETVDQNFILLSADQAPTLVKGTEVKKILRTANDVTGTLTAPVTAGATTLPVDDGTKYTIGEFVTFDLNVTDRHEITDITVNDLTIGTATTADLLSGDTVYVALEQALSYNIPVYVEWVDATDNSKVRVTNNDPIAETDEVSIDNVISTVNSKLVTPTLMNYITIDGTYADQTSPTIGSELFEVTQTDFEERDAFLIYSESPGEWANKIAVAVTDSKDYEDAFILDVYYDGILEETFEVSKKEMLSGYGRQMYIEEVVNVQSKYIRVKDNLLMTEEDTDGVDQPVEPLKTTYYLRQPLKTQDWTPVTALTETAWEGDNYLRIDPIDVSAVDVLKSVYVGGSMYTISTISQSVLGGAYDTIVLTTGLALGLDNLTPDMRYLPVGEDISQNFDQAKVETVGIPSFTATETFSITINTVPYSYISGGGDVETDVYDALVALINAGDGDVYATALTVAGGVQLTANTAGVDFTTVISANMASTVSVENAREWVVSPMETITGKVLPTTTVGAIATIDGTVYTILDAGANRTSGGDDAGLATESQYVAALALFENREEVDFLVFMDGGVTTVAYAQAITELCESRMDCVGLLSVSFEAQASADLADVVAYREAIAINSSYVALYASWVRILDKYNDIRIWVHPESFAARAISYTGSQRELFYAPAGWNNGKVRALEVYKVYNKGHRDILYDAQINSFRVHPEKGIAIWGQKDLQATPSVVDRLNVRLNLIVIERALMEDLDNITFDINTAEVRSRAKARNDSFLGDIMAKGGLYGYRVVCDDSNNTTEVITRNEMYIDIYVEPVIGIEYPIGRVAITKQGASMQAVIQ